MIHRLNGITTGAALFIILALLFCTDPLNPMEMDENARITINPSKTAVPLSEAAVFEVTLKLPHLIKSAIIDYGDGEKDTLIVENSDTLYLLEHSYERRGEMVVTATAFTKSVTNSATCRIDIISPAQLLSDGAVQMSGSLEDGANIYLSVLAEGSEPINYTWYKDGVALPQSDSSTFVIMSLQNADRGEYYCIIGNDYGGDTSESYHVTLETATKPQILNGKDVLENGIAAVDSAFSLSIEIADDPTSSLQWYKNDTAIEGENSNILSFDVLQRSDSGEYYCVVENHIGKDTSEVFKLVIVPRSYSISLKAGSYGTITPLSENDTVEVAEGEDLECMFTPDEGYRIGEVLIDGEPVGAAAVNGLYTFSNIRSNYSVEVNFEKIMYKVSLTKTGNGSVTTDPSVTDSIAHGAELTVEATPEDGFYFSGWEGETSESGNPLFVTVTGNLEITAKFARIDRYTVNVSIISDEGTYTIIPDSVDYAEGTEVTLEATAKTGYKFVGWSGDTITDANPLTMTLTKTYDLTAVFQKKRYIITATAGAGGNIAPEGENVLLYGDSASFTIEADDGYRIDSVRVDGEIDSAAKTDGRKTFRSVDQNHTIKVFSSIIPNLPPVIHFTGTTIVDEQDTVRITISAEDPEGDDLQFSAELLDFPAGHNAIFDETNSVFIWATSYQHAGEYSVKFKVSDSQLEDSVTVVLKVNNVNRLPEITITQPQAGDVVQKSVPLEINAHIIDPDENLDSVIVYVDNQKLNVFRQNTISALWVPENSGNTVISIAAFDTDGGYDSAYIYVTVNTPPSFDAYTPPATADIGNVLSEIVVATEIDEGDNVTYTCIANPPGMTINSSTGELNWDIPWDASFKIGTSLQVSIEAADERGGKDTLSWEITPITHAWLDLEVQNIPYGVEEIAVADSDNFYYSIYTGGPYGKEIAVTKNRGGNWDVIHTFGSLLSGYDFFAVNDGVVTCGDDVQHSYMCAAVSENGVIFSKSHSYSNGARARQGRNGTVFWYAHDGRTSNWTVYAKEEVIYTQEDTYFGVLDVAGTDLYTYWIEKRNGDYAIRRVRTGTTTPSIKDVDFPICDLETDITGEIFYALDTTASGSDIYRWSFWTNSHVRNEFTQDFTRIKIYANKVGWAMTGEGELYFTNDAFATVVKEDIPGGAFVKDVQIGPNDDQPYVIVEDEDGQLVVLK